MSHAVSGSAGRPGGGAVGKGQTLVASDEILVSRCQGGEKKAFELLIQKYQRRIFHLIYRMTQNSDVVEPLAQEVFLKAYRSIASFQGNSQFYTWLYRIAVNTCLSYVKRHSLEDSHENPQDIDPANHHPDAPSFQTENPEQLFIRKEFYNQLTKCLNQLPEELNTTIVMREFMGLNYEEIADVLDIPLGTVRSRIYRARSHLKDLLTPYLNN
jgi:RNA polymerase sigma-70 factor, ECF subfamily